MSTGLFPYWLRLSLEKVAHDAACEVLASEDLILHQGVRTAPGPDAEEWVSIHVMQILPESEAQGEWRGSFVFQVSCFSRFAEARQDGKTDRPSEMAGLISDLISNKNHLVKDYNSASPEEKGTIYLPKPNRVYLDERELAQIGNQGSMPTNIHSEVLSYRGQAAN